MGGMSPWNVFLQTFFLLPAAGAQPRGPAPAGDFSQAAAAPAPALDACKAGTQQSELNSFLWTIKRDPPSYFFGTIHVPYTRVWDFIPENSKAAFQQSSIVYFELDLTDPYTISALTSCQMLPQGENLQDVLPQDIYCRLKRHLDYVKLMMPSWMTPDQRGKGLYADYLFNAIAGNWERKRPVWVMLMVNSLTEVDIKSRGVPVLDLYLAQEAERLKKQTGAVEKVEEQCHPLNGLNFSQVPNFINATLPPQERITAQEIDSYFRQELIYKRNERMGKRVKALLEEYPDKGFFFAFGAGHFMGNDTVLDVLRREGYEVEHTPAGQPINNEKPRRTPSTLSPPPPAHASNGISQVSGPLGSPGEEEEEEEEDEEEMLLPHLLLPGNADLLEKMDRKYRKKKKKQMKKQRLRQFSDLWVRLEESAPAPLPRIRIVNGYITVEPLLPGHRRSPHVQTVSNSACLSLWTLLFWLLTLALQTEITLL
ncbi:metalloprotease TIKI1 isoform X3 [Monodelphis domestica]|uniref:metalloprotease TIKI1 isoform X3 n=1 Tax=Monodelphis domestica TaxID=13616 RepID=UPI0024E25CC6|nr:metalloprotease TIKI1 isoform X3 [Monodelphis domestica]